MYVYILSSHDEYGAEDLVATLDRSKLEGLVKENWPHQSEWEDWARKQREEWLNDGINGLRKHLAKSDEELSSSQSGWNCHEGWGGMQLHVAKLR